MALCAARVEVALPESQSALLIQDREADIFNFFSATRQKNIDLLIRVTHPRRVEAIAGTQSSLLSWMP